MFQQFRRRQIAELRPYEPGEALSNRVSISAADLEAGSPKLGDMIARNPKNHDDQWLVAADYFADNFEPIQATAQLAQSNYDPDADVLYISFGDPQPADDGLEHDGVLHRYRDGALIGITILNAKARLS